MLDVPTLNPDGILVYGKPVPQGFLIYVEAQPGISGRPAGRSTFNPEGMPDLQMLVSNDLGINPTAKVCDATPGDLGGVLKVDPPVFAETVADSVNDLTCRFDARSLSSDACTKDNNFNNRFVSPVLPSARLVQFCTSTGVGQEYRFPPGAETKVTARVRDDRGNPGPENSIIIKIDP